MSFYTKCSKCEKKLFTNAKLFESRKAKYPEAKEVVEGKDTTLEGSEYICQGCKAASK